MIAPGTQTRHVQTTSYATMHTGTDGAGTPPPFSPFSTYSSERSGSALATSDDAPDLGAFEEVFAALHGLRTRVGRTGTTGAGTPLIPRTTLGVRPSSSMLAMRSSDEDDGFSQSQQSLSHASTTNNPSYTYLTHTTDVSRQVITFQDDTMAFAQARSELEDEPLLSPLRYDSASDVDVLGTSSSAAVAAAARVLHIMHPARPSPRSRFATEPLLPSVSTTTQDTFPGVITATSSTTQDAFPLATTTHQFSSSYSQLHVHDNAYKQNNITPYTAQPSTATRSFYDLLALSSAHTPRRQTPLHQSNRQGEGEGEDDVSDLSIEIITGSGSDTEADEPPPSSSSGFDQDPEDPSFTAMSEDPNPPPIFDMEEEPDHNAEADGDQSGLGAFEDVFAYLASERARIISHNPSQPRRSPSLYAGAMTISFAGDSDEPDESNLIAPETWKSKPKAKGGNKNRSKSKKRRTRRKQLEDENGVERGPDNAQLNVPAYEAATSSSFEPSGSSLDISSSPLTSSLLHRNTPPSLTTIPKSLAGGTPNRKARRRAQQQQKASQAPALALAGTQHEQRPPTRLALAHSRSTPSLRPVATSTLLPLGVVPATAKGTKRGKGDAGEAGALNPRVIQLRTLAHKLRLLFPRDDRHIAKVLAKVNTKSPSNAATVASASVNPNSAPSTDMPFDPRGPDPGPTDSIIHVFIDHSNILIGLLNYLRRRPHSLSRQGRKHISHAALALVLERGRPITRRVLATSSPLYQPMDAAEALGYEVRVYARVPDTGDGADRQRGNSNSNANVAGSSIAPNGNGGSNGNGSGGGRPGQRRRRSSAAQALAQSGQEGGSGSDPAQLSAHGGALAMNTTTSASGPNTPATTFSAAQALPMRRRHRHTQSLNTQGSNVLPTSAPLPALGSSPGTNYANGNGAALTTSNGRIRYREQGVDELLQLKLHQALAATDPGPGGTIVLATGDGNVGQFNEEGFLGCVRTALRRGWRVELYAWEEGLSRAWKREFGDEDGFEVLGLEKFALELVEIGEAANVTTGATLL